MCQSEGQLLMLQVGINPRLDVSLCILTALSWLSLLGGLLWILNWLCRLYWQTAAPPERKPWTRCELNGICTSPRVLLILIRWSVCHGGLISITTFPGAIQQCATAQPSVSECNLLLSPSNILRGYLKAIMSFVLYVECCIKCLCQVCHIDRRRSRQMGILPSYSHITSGRVTDISTKL